MASRDILESIQRQMFGELRDDHLSKQARSSNTAAYGTWRRLGGDHTVAAMGARILGQDVDVEFKAGWDELQHACLIFADACLGLSAVRANLLGLGDIVLDANLRQPIVVRFA